MKITLTYDATVPVAPIRRALLNAGLDCSAEDCVPLANLKAHLTQNPSALIVAAVGERPDVATPAIAQLKQLHIPAFIVGPENQQLSKLATSPITRYVPADRLDVELDGLLDWLANEGLDPRPRGRIISVLAPTAGSGGTTIAVNLAGELAKDRADQVALADLNTDGGDVALWLDVAAAAGLHDLATRIDRLDRAGLVHSLTPHRSGLRLLASPAQDAPSSAVTPAAMGRIVRLLRIAYPITVLRHDRHLDEAQLEALRQSETILLVVRPDVPSVKRARLTWETLRLAGLESKCQLVVNRNRLPGRLSDNAIESAMGLPIAHTIVDDPKSVTQAVNQGLLLWEWAPRATITRDIERLAQPWSSETRPSHAHGIWSTVTTALHARKPVNSPIDIKIEPAVTKPVAAQQPAAPKPASPQPPVAPQPTEKALEAQPAAKESPTQASPKPTAATQTEQGTSESIPGAKPSVTSKPKAKSDTPKQAPTKKSENQKPTSQRPAPPSPPEQQPERELPLFI